MDKDDPQLRAALAESGRVSRQMVGQINALTASIRRDHRKFLDDSRERREQREQDNRDGVNGVDNQRMQQRIDTQQTTWEEVVSGADESANAVKIRQNIDQGVSYLRSLMDNDKDVARDQAEIDRANTAIQRAQQGLL